MPQPTMAATTSYWLPAATSLVTTHQDTWLQLSQTTLMAFSFVTWERLSRPRLALTPTALPLPVSSAPSSSLTQLRLPPLACLATPHRPAMLATRAMRPITLPLLLMACLPLRLMALPLFSQPFTCQTVALCKLFISLFCYQSIIMFCS